MQSKRSALIMELSTNDSLMSSALSMPFSKEGISAPETVNVLLRPARTFSGMAIMNFHRIFIPVLCNHDAKLQNFTGIMAVCITKEHGRATF